MLSYEALLQDVKINAESLKAMEEERLKMLEATEKLRGKYANEEESSVGCRYFKIILLTCFNNLEAIKIKVHS